ncbi:hypothetical protein ABK040_009250 [Willaertia magna]
MQSTKRIVVKQYPKGIPTENDFEIQTIQINTDLEQNEILVELLDVSVDPYMRIRLRENVPSGYFPSYPLGEPMLGGCIVKVLNSKHPGYLNDEIILGQCTWQIHQKLKITDNEKNYLKIEQNEKVPLSYYLGSVGMPGHTAYFGLLKVCQAKQGETVVVSAASGAVGNMVGQIAKIKGCHTVGITGSDDKIELLKSIGFDEVINYKHCNKDILKLKELIEKTCPKGVDCYFDNTGGFILDAVTLCMNVGGRIAFCGAISSYNEEKLDADTGPRLSSLYVIRRLKGIGFLVYEFEEEYPKANEDLIRWVNEEKIKVLETKEKGFENIPKAFVKLFTGEKLGKIVIEM